MKKISKLFLSFILVALCACSIIPFAGCGEPDWQEVQSVSYNYYGQIRTLTSYCKWEITTEDITRVEYESAPNESKIQVETSIASEVIKTNRQEFLTYANSKIGEVYYSYDCYYPSLNNTVYFYYKYTLKSYKLEYVKVKILENDCLEINYYNDIIKISPSENGYLNDSDLPYEITYFED